MTNQDRRCNRKRPNELNVAGLSSRANLDLTRPFVRLRGFPGQENRCEICEFFLISTLLLCATFFSNPACSVCRLFFFANRIKVESCPEFPLSTTFLIQPSQDCANCKVGYMHQMPLKFKEVRSYVIKKCTTRVSTGERRVCAVPDIDRSFGGCGGLCRTIAAEKLPGGAGSKEQAR